MSEDPRAAGLVRYAKRLADRLRAPWMALTIEDRRSAQLGELERDRVADTLRLAERLGAETVTIPSQGRIAEDVVGFAQERNVTHVVLGKSARSRWFEVLHGSVVHDLVRRSGPISVHVVAGEVVEGEPVPRKTVRTAAPPRLERLGYLASLGAVSCALGLGLLVQPWLGHENADLIFLTAVVAVAVRFGLYPSLLAVVASSLSYNFFFLPPLYTFTIADPTNVVALFFFTLVAVLVSNLAARTRIEALISRSRARATEALYGFSRSTTSSGPAPIRSR